jgi:hypothetical protein
LKKIDAGVFGSGGYIQRNLNTGFTKTGKMSSRKKSCNVVSILRKQINNSI